MLQKPFRHTRSPVFSSFISASASSRPEILSSALSLAVASVARLSSLSFSFWVSTPRSVSDSPTFWTFLTASAETDFPAACTNVQLLDDALGISELRSPFRDGIGARLGLVRIPGILDIGLDRGLEVHADVAQSAQ